MASEQSADRAMWIVRNLGHTDPDIADAIRRAYHEGQEEMQERAVENCVALYEREHNLTPDDTIGDGSAETCRQLRDRIRALPIEVM